MTRILLLLCIFLLAGPSYAQKSKAKKGPKTGGSFFSKLDRKYAKYFATIGAGKGQASWNSTLGSTTLVDNNGATITSGNLKFKAKNNFDTYYLEVSMPVSNFRLGLGINFDYNYVDKLTILDPRGDYIILYSETFRFDKFYVNYEIPFNARTEKAWSFSVKGNIGYYGLSYVTHDNFFGQEALAKNWFFGLGPLGDIKPYPHTYIFIYPQVEYIYFNNSRLEAPAEVIHKIFRYAITAGIRVDVSKE